MSEEPVSDPQAVVPVAVHPEVRLLSCSDFRPVPGLDFGLPDTDTDPDGDQTATDPADGLDAGSGLLAEFAGRACYQSFDKPVAATATNAGFLAHILEVGHLQVLEHPQASFYVTGISQGAAHELLRHRHLSMSQLSPRFDPLLLAGRDEDGGSPPGAAVSVVEPAAVAADEQLHRVFTESVSASVRAYRVLVAEMEARLSEQPDARLRRSQARQLAASVLPRAVETRAVISGNFRAWRHVIAMRGSEHADAELRELVIAILTQLQQAAPNAFGDFVLLRLADGTRSAHSPLVVEG